MGKSNDILRAKVFSFAFAGIYFALSQFCGFAMAGGEALDGGKSAGKIADDLNGDTKRNALQPFEENEIALCNTIGWKPGKPYYNVVIRYLVDVMDDHAQDGDRIYSRYQATVDQMERGQIINTQKFPVNLIDVDYWEEKNQFYLDPRGSASFEILMGEAPMNQKDQNEKPTARDFIDPIYWASFQIWHRVSKDGHRAAIKRLDNQLECSRNRSGVEFYQAGMYRSQSLKGAK